MLFYHIWLLHVVYLLSCNIYTIECTSFFSTFCGEEFQCDLLMVVKKKIISFYFFNYLTLIDFSLRSVFTTISMPSFSKNMFIKIFKYTST